MRVGLRAAFAIGTAIGVIFAGACRRSEVGSATVATAANAIAAAPLGQVAGASANVKALSTANPFEGNPQGIEQGKQLYIKMNCAGCHAYNGKGNMGPDLTDTYWRYGGLPVEIYQSIEQGRPQGMPAWGAALPPEDIWKLVAYIESFGGSVAAKDYEQARHGDEPGEQVAPEVLEQKP